MSAGATEALRYAAFTVGGRGGNPAGIVLDAAHLDDRDRLGIAAAMGYSETAFVEPVGRAGDRRVPRWRSAGTRRSRPPWRSPSARAPDRCGSQRWPG